MQKSTNFVYIKLENPPRSAKEHFFSLLRFLWLLQGKCQKHIKLQANVCWRNAKPTMNYDRYSIKDDCEINFLPHFPPKSFCQIARQSLTRKISTNLKGVVRIMEQNPIWSYKYVYYIILYIYLSFYVMRLHKVLLFSKLTFSYLSCKEKKLMQLEKDSEPIGSKYVSSKT